MWENCGYLTFIYNISYIMFNANTFIQNQDQCIIIKVKTSSKNTENTIEIVKLLSQTPKSKT